jgi:LPXTG-motif cell wall-anchored protein
MNPKIPRALVLLTALLVGSARVAAQETELSFPAALDTSIYSSGDFSDAQGPYIWVSVLADGTVRRALLKFDLASIPVGATVTEARLDLYQSRARDGHNVSLHRLLASWGEGASNGGSQGMGAPAQIGDATWAHRFFPATLWANQGGDFDLVASATIFVGADNQFYSWLGRPAGQGGPNPRMLDDVQRWVNTPSQNHGWILIGDESVEQNAKRLQSAENGTLPPRLVVRFTPPAPPETGDVPLPPWALAGLAAALAAGLLGGRRRRP